MKKSKNPILIPQKERLVTAEQYLQEMQLHSDIIASSEFIPPKLGSKGYGKFLVRYTTPVLLPKGV